MGGITVFPTFSPGRTFLMHIDTHPTTCSKSLCCKASTQQSTYVFVPTSLFNIFVPSSHILVPYIVVPTSSFQHLQSNILVPSSLIIVVWICVLGWFYVVLWRVHVPHDWIDGRLGLQNDCILGFNTCVEQLCRRHEFCKLETVDFTKQDIT